MRTAYPRRIPALVVGSGNLALGAVRVLGRRGIPVYCASPVPGIERASRWYRPAPGRWTDGSLAANLVATGLDRAVLIPTSEDAAIEASLLDPALASRFPSSSARADILRALADKELTEELLERFDVPRPRTWPISSADVIANLDDETLRHVFLKPRDSGRFSAEFSRKSLRPEGRQAIVETITAMAERGFEMVLQEYVPGPASNSYLLDGFIDREGRVGGLFARRRVRQYPLDFGNSSCVRSVPRSEISSMEPVILRFLAEIGYRGIFNAEFKRDERDGSWRLFEINCRTWLYAEFAARCGFDALTMAYEDALGLPVTPGFDYEVGRTVIYPYFDLWACRALIKSGTLRFGTAARQWLSADQLVYVPDDPRPFILAVGELWAGAVGRRLH